MQKRLYFQVGYKVIAMPVKEGRRYLKHPQYQSATRGEYRVFRKWHALEAGKEVRAA